MEKTRNIETSSRLVVPEEGTYLRAAKKAFHQAYSEDVKAGLLSNTERVDKGLKSVLKTSAQAIIEQFINEHKTNLRFSYAELKKFILAEYTKLKLETKDENTPEFTYQREFLMAMYAFIAHETQTNRKIEKQDRRIIHKEEINEVVQMEILKNNAIQHKNRDIRNGESSQGRVQRNEAAAEQAPTVAPRAKREPNKIFLSPSRPTIFEYPDNAMPENIRGPHFRTVAPLIVTALLAFGALRGPEQIFAAGKEIVSDATEIFDTSKEEEKSVSQGDKVKEALAEQIVEENRKKEVDEILADLNENEEEITYTQEELEAAQNAAKDENFTINEKVPTSENPKPSETKRVNTWEELYGEDYFDLSAEEKLVRLEEIYPDLNQRIIDFNKVRNPEFTNGEYGISDLPEIYKRSPEDVELIVRRIKEVFAFYDGYNKNVSNNMVITAILESRLDRFAKGNAYHGTDERFDVVGIMQVLVTHVRQRNPDADNDYKNFSLEKCRSYLYDIDFNIVISAELLNGQIEDRGLDVRGAIESLWQPAIDSRTSHYYVW